MLGLKNRGTKCVTCCQCGNGLVDFQITKTNEDLIDQNIKPSKISIDVICTKCNTTEQLTVEGQFYVGAGQENVFLEYENERENSLTILVKFKKYG